MRRLTVDVEGPYGAFMAIVGAETLAVVGEPDVDDMVLRAGEEKVAFAIELDLCEGSFVACVWRVEMRKF